MDKQSVIKQLASDNAMTQVQARAVLEAMLEELVKLLQQGDMFRQRDFGTFRSVVRKERIGFHPAKRKKMLLPRKRRIKFTAAERLKRLLNE